MYTFKEIFEEIRTFHKQKGATYLSFDMYIIKDFDEKNKRFIMTKDEIFHGQKPPFIPHQKLPRELGKNGHISEILADNIAFLIADVLNKKTSHRAKDKYSRHLKKKIYTYAHNHSPLFGNLVSLSVIGHINAKDVDKIEIVIKKF